MLHTERYENEMKWQTKEQAVVPECYESTEHGKIECFKVQCKTKSILVLHQQNSIWHAKRLQTGVSAVIQQPELDN